MTAKQIAIYSNYMMERIPQPDNKIEKLGDIQETKRIDVSRAVEREQGIMQKLRGKARELVGGFMVLTAVTLGEGVVRRASALEGLNVEKGESVEEFENREASEERAVAFLGELMRARAREDITNPAQQRLMAERVARVMIQSFAGREKNLGKNLPPGAPVDVSFKDVCEALNTLNSASGEFADRTLGNKDGKVDGGDIAALQKASATNAGIKTFVEMSAQCR